MSDTAYAIGSVVLFLSSSLSSAGGVGGGVLNVGIFLVIWGFSFHESSVLSLAALMGNYLSQVLINCWQHHPNSKSRPLIYFDAVLILFPCQLGGATTGVILSYVFPESVLLIIALLVLTFAIYVGLQKGYYLFQKESIELQCDTGSAASYSDSPTEPDGELQSLISAPTSTDPEDQSNVDGHDLDYPWMFICIILSIWLLYAIDYVLLELVTTCTWEFYALFVSIYPLIAMQLYYSYHALLSSQAPPPHPAPESISASNVRTIDAVDSHISPKIEVGADGADCQVSRLAVESAAAPNISAGVYAMTVLEGDILWDQITVIPLLTAFLIGVIAVMIGIGGGELMSPLLYSLGVPADVAAATVPLMSLLSTSASIVHYMTLDDLNYYYCGWVFGIGLAGGLTGRTTALIVQYFSKRASSMIFVLVSVMTMSLAMFCYYLYLDAADLDFVFTSLC